MNTDEITAAFREVISRWRPSMRVWHRGHGRRGIITAYSVCADGSILLQVAYGDSTMTHYPCELSAVRISEDDEADAWRDGEEEMG